jgi:hypothetical protein
MVGIYDPFGCVIQIQFNFYLKMAVFWVVAMRGPDDGGSKDL